MKVNRFICGDALTLAQSLPAQSIHTIVTSPPYWGLRDYGIAGQYGQEATPEAYTERLVHLFDSLRHALRDDGTLWLNLGDCYAGSWGSYGHRSTQRARQHTLAGKPSWTRQAYAQSKYRPPTAGYRGLKPKNLVGIPWRVAFALQGAGWYLRTDIIWHKPNAMPESVKDRPSRSHEYLFLLAKSARYYYDYQAVLTPYSAATHKRMAQPTLDRQGGGRKGAAYQANFPGRKQRDRPAATILRAIRDGPQAGSNRRTVWRIATRPFKEAHFAVYPPDLIEPCILAGCPPDGLVLDPFMGAGTTALVAESLGRRWLGFELNPEYITIARRRLAQAREERKKIDDT